MSMTTSLRGVLSCATCTIIRPIGPAPAITTTSSSWMSPRLTAWIAQASGSMIAASSSDDLRRNPVHARGRRECACTAPCRRRRLRAGSRRCCALRTSSTCPSGNSGSARRARSARRSRGRRAPTPKCSAAPSPSSSTWPKNSWPGIDRRLDPRASSPPQNIFAPDQHLQSLAQMPQAPMRITSSPAPARGRGELLDAIVLRAVADDRGHSGIGGGHAAHS